ncbi:MAG: PspC domain-containing protein [Tissierellia bacterium]|nr:PspC domain-containing protein [Tissierellia bacterium]
MKKIYRSKTNRIIGGVCGGIGEYFDIDPSVIRVIWVLLTMLGAFGLIPYLLCWLIIPQEKNGFY